MILTIIAFALTIYQDPMTDHKTHVAQKGNDDSYSIAVYCGDLTNYRPALTFTMKAPIWSGYNGAFTSSRLGKIRFDNNEPISVRMNYAREQIIIQGEENNIEMIDRLQNSNKLTVELYDYRARAMAVKFDLEDPDNAIDKAISECGR